MASQFLMTDGWGPAPNGVEAGHQRAKTPTDPHQTTETDVALKIEDDGTLRICFRVPCGKGHRTAYLQIALPTLQEITEMATEKETAAWLQTMQHEEDA